MPSNIGKRLYIKDAASKNKNDAMKRSLLAFLAPTSEKNVASFLKQT